MMTFRRASAPAILASALGEDGPLAGAAEKTWIAIWGSLLSPSA